MQAPANLPRFSFKYRHEQQALELQKARETDRLYNKECTKRKRRLKSYLKQGGCLLDLLRR